MMRRLVLGLSALALATTANAKVINISGTANGESQGNGACMPQDQPCNNGALINPVQVSLTAGTYTLSDAYSPTTGFEPGALYDAWNFESGNATPWVWNYNVFYDDGRDGSLIGPGNYYTYLLFNVNAPVAGRRTTEAAAAAEGASLSTLSFSLTQATTLDFVVNDYYLPDNAGGVSLDVENTTPPPSPVPEPGSWALALFGFSVLGAALRRGRRMSGWRRANQSSI